MMLFLLIWLSLILIRPQDYPQYAEAGIPILPITMAAAVLAWALGRDRYPFRQPTYLLFAVFCLIGTFSVAVNGWVGGAWPTLMRFIPLLVALVLITQAATRPVNCMRLMWVVCLSALVLAIHGIEQVELGEGWTGMPTVQDGRIQYVGIFSDPNDLAMLFVMAIPMALLLSSRGGFLGLRRLFWWAVAGTLLYGVYLTDSRGAFLAVMAMGGVWLWLRRGLVVAGTAGAVGLALLMMLPTRMQELDAGESSAYGRIETWYDGIQMFIEHPVFGVGVGNFTDHTFLTAHNSFILVLAETGIVGYTVWLAMVVYTFLMPIAVLRTSIDTDSPEHLQLWAEERRMAMTLLISLVGVFACSFFLSRSYIVLLYVLIGMVAGWYTGAQDRWPFLPVFSLERDWIKWCFISVGSTLALWITVKVLFVAAGA